MSALKAEMEARLRRDFPDGSFQLNNPNHDDVHFELIVTSPQFRGKTRIEQHQLVYRSLGDMMHQAVHALSLKTLCPPPEASPS